MSDQRAGVTFPFEPHLNVDEYGTIWAGDPGAVGSTVVGDLIWSENEEGGHIEWLPVDQRRTVPAR